LRSSCACGGGGRRAGQAADGLVIAARMCGWAINKPAGWWRRWWNPPTSTAPRPWTWRSSGRCVTAPGGAPAPTPAMWPLALSHTHTEPRKLSPPAHTPRSLHALAHALRLIAPPVAGVGGGGRGGRGRRWPGGTTAGTVIRAGPLNWLRFTYVVEISGPLNDVTEQVCGRAAAAHQLPAREHLGLRALRARGGPAVSTSASVHIG
jgi:hypothetical protein